MNAKETALSRAEMIVKVRAGQMTAQAAALTLGVSRKTYYKWEKKGLQAMLAQVKDEPKGRPSTAASKEVQALKDEVKELQEKLAVAEKTAEIRGILRIMEKQGAKKKQKRSPKS
jgi:transposase